MPLVCFEVIKCTVESQTWDQQKT